MVREPHDVKILQKTPTKGWRAVYAVPREGGRAKLEEERISVFALCEDEEGRRFVSGIAENGELCAMRDDFVGLFSVKAPRHKIREAFGRVARDKERKEMSNALT